MNDVPLRDYIESKIEDIHRQQLLADDEREKAADALREQLVVQIRTGDEALERHITDQINSIKAALSNADKLRNADQEAIDKAFDAATKLSEAHNGLLRKMENLQTDFVTKENLDEKMDARAERTKAIAESADTRLTRLETWQARTAGGLVVIGAIGVSNFVRVWGG